VTAHSFPPINGSSQPPRTGWLLWPFSALSRRTAQGVAVTFYSLVVLIPLAALFSNAFTHGWGFFWKAATAKEALSAYRLTITCSVVAALVNAVAGLGTAWVLVRDSFKGKAILNALIDLPFALPTVVAGVTFYTLYGPKSPVHLTLTGTWTGITVAIVFVTLPFTVRSVQPVIETMTFNAEAAAATLGASPWRVFRTITLPTLLPAIVTGAGLAFARAMGEYGSVVFISNNLPFRTEVASSYIYSLASAGDPIGAAATAVMMLVVALCVLVVVSVTSRRLVKGH